MPAVTPHRLLTLGRLTLLDAAGDEHRELATRKRKLALLTLLAISRRAWSRDALVDLFWGEQPDARARHSLSDALSHLRRVLGPDAITQRRTEVALADDLVLAVDVRELQDAVRAQQWEHAVACYGGPFLDALHIGGSPRLSQWIDDERRRLDGLFGTAARAECERLLREGWHDESAALARRWLTVAPASPHAALFRLRALAAPGTPEADQQALEEFQTLTHRLERDLGTRPDHVVEALAREIEARHRTRQVAPPLAVPEATPSAPSVPEPTGQPVPDRPQPHAIDVAPARRPRRRYGWLLAGAATAAVTLLLWRRPAAQAAQRNTAPVTAALTASPRAKSLYDRAVIAYDRDGNHDEAVALLDSAIALDSSFAMAYRRLGQILDNGVDGRTRSVFMLSQAARYADRLPPAERFMTLGAYHRTVTGNFARAASAFRALLDLNPNDARAWASLGTVYDYLGDRARAVESYERSLSLDPKRAVTWMNVADGRYTLGDVAGAWRSLDSMALAFPGHPGLFMRSAMLAHAEGQRARAEEQLRALISSAADNVYQRAAGEMLLAKAYWSWGRLNEGDAARRRSIVLDRSRGARDAALVGELDVAMATIWLRGDTLRAREQLTQALRQTPLHTLPVADRPYLDAGMAHASVGNTLAAQALLDEYVQSTDSIGRWRNVSREHQARGMIALARREWPAAIAELRQVADPLCSVCGLPELSLAYARAGQADSAVATYQRYLRTPSQRRLDMTDVFHGERMAVRARELRLEGAPE